MYYSTKKTGFKKPKKKSLPRAWPMALGKEYLKKIKNLCRVPDGGHSAKTDASGRRDPSGHICRGPICRGLGPRQRFILPRAVCLPRAGPLAKASLPRAQICRGLLGLALGKDALCRVPEIQPSANPEALGKEDVSSMDMQSDIFSSATHDPSCIYIALFVWGGVGFDTLMEMSWPLARVEQKQLD